MKSFGKLGMLAIALAALLLLPSTAFAESVDPTLPPGTPNNWRPSVAEILPESYRQVDLHEQNMLTIPDACGLQTSAPEKTFLPGIVLTGTEIKSVRAGGVNLRDSYAKVEKGEVFVYNMNIAPYEKGR